MATNKTASNPAEVLISKFRLVVDEMETISTDTELADKVRAYKLLVVSTGQVIELCEKVGIEVDAWAHKVYEQAVLATDGAFGDDQLKRRVESLVVLADDFGLQDTDLTTIDLLVNRYNKAKDAFMEAVAPPKKQRGNGEAKVQPTRFTNNRTEYVTDSLRGMKKHLTGVLGGGWEKEGVEIYDAEDGGKVVTL